MRGDVDQEFDEWIDVFRSGLRMMRERGDLSEDADPERLAYALTPALQGACFWMRPPETRSHCEQC